MGTKSLARQKRIVALLALLSLFFASILFPRLEAEAAAPVKAPAKDASGKAASGKASPKVSPSSLPGAVTAGKGSEAGLSKTPLTPALVKPKKGSKLSLWKVSTESGAVLYLIGTIHLFKKEYYPLPDEMEKALLKAKALILEVKPDSGNTQHLVAQLGLFPPGDTLETNLKPDTFSRLKNYCRKSGIPVERFQRMRPWLAAVTITVHEVIRLGYQIESGIDRYLMNLAQVQGKKVIGIETDEFQLRLFASLPPDLQDKYLDLTLIDLDILSKQLSEIMLAWNSGDETGMDEILSQSIKDHPELAPVQEKILYERNKTMTDSLELYLKGADTYLAAVGCAHLIGPRSIVSYLKERGYKVEQMIVGQEI